MDFIQHAKHMVLDPDNPGEVVEDAHLKNELKVICQRLSGSPNPNRFAGSQPVSLLREHMSELTSKPWMVCEKSDGVRYLLLIHRINFVVHRRPASWDRVLNGQVGSCYLVSRKLEFITIPTLDHFLGESLLRSLDGTLLDGELVHDNVPLPDDVMPNVSPGNDEAAKKLLRLQSTFLIFDALSVRNTFVGDLDLFDRLRAVQGEFMFRVRSNNPNPPPIIPCVLTLKQMYATLDIGFVLEDVIKSNLPHENDGLIFTRIDKPYKCGKTTDILKWKPRHLNSVDFEIVAMWGQSDRGEPDWRYCYLNAAKYGSSIGYGPIWLDEQQHAYLKEKYGGKPAIVECVLDDNWFQYQPPRDQTVPWAETRRTPGQAWKFLRVREDKHIANDIKTVQGVLQSIESGITEETLISALGRPLPQQRQRARTSSSQG